MVTAVRPSRPQYQNLHPQPRLSSQRLKDKALSIEERIHRLRDRLTLEARAEALEKEVRELATQLLREKPLNPWKYWQLKRELIAIAAVAGITLSIFSNHVTLSDLRLVGQPQLVPTTLVQPRSFLRSEASLRTDREQTDSEAGARPRVTGIQLDALAKAFISQESGGRYDLTNSDSGALGYFQVMPSNVPSWTQEALGYKLSPASFLNSPNLQMKVGKFKLRQYSTQQSKPGRSEEEIVRRVAALWYSGQAHLWDSTKPQTYGGHSYPSIAQYTSSVYGKYKSELGKVQTASSLSTDNTGSKQELNSTAAKMVSHAQAWVGRYFKEGESARCADFIRNLVKEVGIKVPVSTRPVDADKQGNVQSPEMAQSFFGKDVGQLIWDKDKLLPGDLVGFANTYGNWAPGTITHIGIYVGNGQIVDRSTRSKPVFKRSINTFNFLVGVRPYAYQK